MFAYDPHETHINYPRSPQTEAKFTPPNLNYPVPHDTPYYPAPDSYVKTYQHYLPCSVQPFEKPVTENFYESQPEPENPVKSVNRFGPESAGLLMNRDVLGENSHY